MRTQDVLIKPRVTEKSLEAGKSSVVSFFVATNATKHQIKHRIETLFGVTVGSVRTAMRKGQDIRVGKRRVPKAQSDIKIANIEILAGDVSVFPKS